MLKIMVVETLAARRGDLIDAICERPGVLACGAAGFLDALRMASDEPVDAFVVGALPEPQLEQLTALAHNVPGCEVLVVEDADQLVARIESLLVRHRREPHPSAGPRSPTSRGMQTLVLKDWLPAMCARFAAMMPAYVELVPLVSGDTPPVRCEPEALDHEMFDIVREAAAKLPWGGTIWLTAELASHDTVRIDVLENGLGTGDDVTLRTAAPVSS